jgi:hypothetical protein
MIPIVSKVINFFKWLFVEIPKQTISFVKTLKNDIPILYIIIIISDLIKRFFRQIFTTTNIPVILLEIISKVAVSYYVNYKLIRPKCINNKEYNKEKEIFRLLTESITLIGITSVVSLIIKFVPIVGIMTRILRMIPFIGGSILWSSIFIVVTFVYSVFYPKPSNYCTTITNLDYGKIGVSLFLFFFFNIRKLIKPIENYEDEE